MADRPTGRPALRRNGYGWLDEWVGNCLELLAIQREALGIAWSFSRSRAKPWEFTGAPAAKKVVWRAAGGTGVPLQSLMGTRKKMIPNGGTPRRAGNLVSNLPG